MAETIIGITPIVPRRPAAKPPTTLAERIVRIVVDELWFEGTAAPRERARQVTQELRYTLGFQRRMRIDGLTARVDRSGGLVLLARVDGVGIVRSFPKT